MCPKNPHERVQFTALSLKVVLARRAPRLRDLAWCKVFYFLYFASVAPFFPYVNLYLKGIGLSGEQIGVIGAITPTMGLFTQAIWGTLSDGFGGRRRVLMLTTLGAAAMVLLFPLTANFYLLAAVMAAFSVFSNPIVPVADSMSLGCLESSEGEYGWLRLWGSIGFSLMVPVAGWILQRTSLANIFVLYSGLMFITHLASRRMPETQGGGRGSDSPGKRLSLSGIRRLMGDRNFVGFLVAIFILQAATVSVVSFFPIHLNRMGASTLVIGMANVIAAVSEIPAFRRAGRLMRKLGSKAVVTWASATYILRFLVYALSPTPGPILLIQIVQGVGFALFYSAAVTFVSEASPHELKTTGQTVFWGVAFGGGAVAGNIVGGFLFDRIGVVNLYLLAALGALLSVILLILVVRPNASVRKADTCAIAV